MGSIASAYVKIEGITGECQDAEHKGWIDVLNFRYSVSQSSSASVGGGIGVSRASFGVLSFIHYLDRATPMLFRYCASGRHIPKVILCAYRGGDRPTEYLRITLADAVIVRAGPYAFAGTARTRETVEISYAHIKIEQRRRHPSGVAGPAVTAAWNVKQNMEA
ncbi:MAG: type VI secretion system tube protein Hcp [Azoarcus sp.]|jgi:type VI secretion system secreted protein Hcp|nr:type VI secretion system tube protein Hcp [Azoarcus sp.]